MKTNQKSISTIPSVNFHLWEPCNMRCKFCFATFKDVKHSILPKGHLPKEEAIKVVQLLAQYGFTKITFAGGEPTLCSWLPDVIKMAKELGMTTMIVTNGSQFDDSFLERNREHLDWIAISIDSLIPSVNLETGRAISGRKPFSVEYYKSIVTKVKHFGYGLKVNTVVTSKNYREDLSELIRFATPKRWKVLQVLPIVGQNDQKVDDFTITDLQFKYFLDIHSGLSDLTRYCLKKCVFGFRS